MFFTIPGITNNYLVQRSNRGLHGGEHSSYYTSLQTLHLGKLQKEAKVARAPFSSGQTKSLMFSFSVAHPRPHCPPYRHCLRRRSRTKTKVIERSAHRVLGVEAHIDRYGYRNTDEPASDIVLMPKSGYNTKNGTPQGHEKKRNNQVFSRYGKRSHMEVT